MQSVKLGPLPLAGIARRKCQIADAARTTNLNLAEATHNTTVLTCRSVLFRCRKKPIKNWFCSKVSSLELESRPAIHCSTVAVEQIFDPELEV